MSQPRAKRQFTDAAKDPAQRQITAFFTPSSTSFSSAAPSTASTTAARGTGSGIGPALPSAVQSSLLSVGMRVRKAVPEGYRTLHGKPISATTAAAAPVSPAKHVLTPSAYTGLAPYCGINKIGGLTSQPQSQPQLQQELAAFALPPLSSSQETIDVAMSDDEDEVNAVFEQQQQIQQQRESKKRMFVSETETQRKEPARGPEVTIVYPERVMAVPRKARPTTTVIEDDDFEEATFLVDIE